MTIPQWSLLAFAVWTLLFLFSTIGAYRWSRILTGRASISEWQADVPQGSDWYRRAMRAHMNCVENLAVFGAIVFCAATAGTTGPWFDLLAVAVFVARVFQTLVHVAFAPSNAAASVRFGFFFIQAMAMLAMAASVAVSAGVL